jgi:hypothetical protein
MVIEGSANLRSNGNAEQYTVFNDDGLCDWWTDWIAGDRQPGKLLHEREVSHGTIK